MGKKGLARSIAGGCAVLGVTIYLAAVEIRSGVTGIDIWWPFPYPWLWGVLVVVVLVSVSWLLIELLAARTESVERDPSGDEAPTPDPAVPSYQWHRTLEDSGLVRFTNNGERVELLSIRPGSMYTRRDAAFSLPVILPREQSVEVQVTKSGPATGTHQLILEWRINGRGDVRRHSFDV